jgi:DNA-binding SARP family transcriptional activator/TolB-like protein
MSKLSRVTLRLLGPFAIEANVGRPIAVSVRAKKARALLAYLAMKPGHRARREELATLFWGDTPDLLARHSLRQCLISLRQDLSVASEILIVDRETIGLNAQLVSVDACAFMALAQAAGAAEADQAEELWRGAFLPDLVLDVEEFDAWRNREADRLSDLAAGVFEALCRSAEVAGDGERAVAAAKRLVELDATREDRQRTALPLFARYKGRDAALSQAKRLTDMLREELDVSPESATRAVIEQIRRGEFDPPPVADSVEQAGLPEAAAAPLAPRVVEKPAVAATAATVAEAPQQVAAPSPFWRRRPRAAAWLGGAVMAAGVAAVLWLAAPVKLSLLVAGPPRSQSVVVLPFAADNAAREDDAALARVLTHDLIGYLSRFSNLRVISEPTSEFYSGRHMESVMTDLGVQYAIVGHVQDNVGDLKIDFQLVDAASQMNIWSDDLQRQRGDPTLIADDTARGIARALAIEIDRLAAASVRAKPNSQLTVGQLVTRGYLALERGTTRENLVAAMKAFNEASRRNPRYLPAQLAVARVQILAAMNFIDLEPQPDLVATGRLLTESLSKFPNSISVLYSLALLHKHHHEFEASMRLLQRCLELNPSLLPAQAQIGDILIRTGQPQKGLDQVLKTMRAATSTDPSIGYWYLYAAEAELELGHQEAALDWALRAETFMPGSPLVQAWLASIYATLGDKPNAAKYAAVLWKTSPDRTRRFLMRPAGDFNDVNSGRGLRLFEGLRLALGSSPG